MPTARTPSTIRRRRRPVAWAAVALGVASLTAACSSTPSNEELVDALMRSGLSEAEARCASDAVYDNLSDDEIAAITERGGSAVRDDTKVDDEPIDVARREIAACRTEHEVTTTTAADDPSNTTASTEAPASTQPIDESEETTTAPADGSVSTTSAG